MWGHFYLGVVGLTPEIYSTSSIVLGMIFITSPFIAMIVVPIFSMIRDRNRKYKFKKENQS